MKNGSIVNFNNNGSHGLSAGILKIENSTVTANENGANGIHTTGELEITNSTVTVEKNRCSISSQWTIPGAVFVGDSGTIKSSNVVIQNNSGSGIYQKRADKTFTIDKSANVTIVKNKAEKLGLGGGIYVNGTAVLADNVALYNNHADQAGDDIYVGKNASITFGPVGSDWVLDGKPDCEDKIDGWYDDNKNLRWEAHAEDLNGNYVKKVNTGTLTGLCALKAAHGLKKPDSSDPGEIKPAEWDTSKSKTTTNLDGDFESNVTLSLPSAEEQLASDVVFVLDKSTSAVVEQKALDMLTNLKTQVKETDAKVKVGVVIFNKAANVTELKDLATEYADIEAAIKQSISSGTNTHAGLIAGENMLDADESVDNSRKYLIFVSDGISYMYNEKATATAWGFKGDTVLNWAGPDNWNSKYGNNEAPSDWNEWLGEIGGQIANQGTEYEYPYGGTAEKATPENASSIYANSIDIALFKTYKQYQSIAAKYNVYALTADTASGSDYKWGPSFVNYLAGGKGVSFDQIENDITYLLDKGSCVEDYMGYVDGDYDFDFVNDASVLSMKVGNTAYKAEKIEDNHYGFGKTDTGYMYEVIYSAGNKQDEEHFTWKINVPVSNFAPVQLTYQVKLTNPKTADGTYGQYDADGSKKYAGLYTNNSATLYPVDSNGKEGDPETFNKPTVEYTVKAGENVTPVVPSEPAVDDPGNDPGIEDPVDPEPDKTVKKPKTTKTESKKKTESVKTGDNTNIILWICLLVLSGAAVISVPVISARLRRGRRRR